MGRYFTKAIGLEVLDASIFEIVSSINQISQNRHTVIDERIGKAKIVANEYSSAYFTDYLKRYL